MLPPHGVWVTEAMYRGVIGPSTQRACANCHVLHLASALFHGSREWCCTWVGKNVVVGDGFVANKGNRTVVQIYIDYRRACKISAASEALYPGRAVKIKPEHTSTSKTNDSRFGSQTTRPGPSRLKITRRRP